MLSSFLFIPSHSRTFHPFCVLMYLQERVLLQYVSPPPNHTDNCVSAIKGTLLLKGTGVLYTTLFKDQASAFTHDRLTTYFSNLISLVLVYHVFYPLHGYHSFLLFKRLGFFYFYSSHIQKSPSGKICIYFWIVFKRQIFTLYLRMVLN